jgi:hypothetical protein
MNGWKLVPVEATPEMVAAGDDLSYNATPSAYYAAMLAAAPEPPAVGVGPVVSEELIGRMVDAFLCWRLPDDFAPDGSVAFNPGNYPEYQWPVGTNLLTAVQARAMFEHVFAHMLPPKQAPLPETPFIEWSLGEAQALVACFGGDNTSITVREFPAAGGKRDDGSVMEPGKYAWCSDYPEEGSSWLGPHDIDTEAFNTTPPAPSAGVSVSEVTDAMVERFKAAFNKATNKTYMHDALIDEAIRAALTALTAQVRANDSGVG